jgi:hypothetical protein
VVYKRPDFVLASATMKRQEVTMRTAVVLGAALAMAAPQVAHAKRKKPAALVGVDQVTEVVPSPGFVDDPMAVDDTGARLLYVHADAAALAELRVVDLISGKQTASVDISGFTTTPTTVAFAPGGYFVVSRPLGGGDATAALIDDAGKQARSFGPATDLVLSTWAGKPAVVVYVKSEASGKTVHEVEVRALTSGKRLGKKTRLTADASGKVSGHDFELRYFADDYTRAVGIKGGTWRKKEDMRSPDYEAEYILPTRTFRKRGDIGDLMTHTRKMQTLSEHPNQPRFATIARDLTGVHLVTERGGKVSELELAQPFHHYDPRSLQQHAGPGGSLFFSLTIDPVNPDAVARKKADPRYLDLYRVAPDATRAERVGRVLVPGKREHRWIAGGDAWVVMPKHIGFDRGGKSLQLYRTR